MSTPTDGDGQTQIVIGQDGRVRVNPTNQQPYWWVGQLSLRFAGPDIYIGTGVLVAPNKVLTCAHNLYDRSLGGAVTAATFALAINGDTQPYGDPVAVTGVAFPEEYRVASPPRPEPNGDVTDAQRYIYDYGVATLGNVWLDPAGDESYPQLLAATDAQLGGRRIDIAGYPGDKPPRTMWNAGGNATALDEELIFYQISTYGGQSGSGVRATFQNLPAPTLPRIVGIHVAGDEDLDANFACRLTQDKINHILGWL